MELVYLVNGNGSGGGGSGGGGGDGSRSAGYPLVKAVVTDGAVGLQDRSVTRVELKTPDPVRINFPPRTAGVARDFLLRLVITADSVPEVTFAVPTGETFSFEERDDGTFACVTGVNVFAAFGSKSAEALQDTFYHDASQWKDFSQTFSEMHKKYAGKLVGSGTIYDRRLQLLVDLTSRSDRTDYAFYNTPHWQLKDLNTSLASWATLKHDAILYAEQPMLAECGGGENLPEPVPTGFVEPNKIFWSQLYLLVKDTRDWLKRCEYLNDDIDSKTENLLESIDFCKLMVDKELRGEAPTYDERGMLSVIGSTLEWMTLGLIDPDLELGSWGEVTGADRSIAQVADIFTRAVLGCDKQGVLYAACGNANIIYVLVNVFGWLIDLKTANTMTEDLKKYQAKASGE